MQTYMDADYSDADDEDKILDQMMEEFDLNPDKEKTTEQAAEKPLEKETEKKDEEKEEQKNTVQD